MSSPSFVEAQDPPPSYDSLYGQIQKARVDSNDSIDFCTAVCAIIFGTVGCLLVLILTLAIPIAFITIGVIYKDDCTVQPLIPIFLMVFGVTGAVQNLIGLYKRLTYDKNEEKNIPLKCFVSLIQLFALAWFITGSVWVFRVYPPEYDDTHLPEYCNYVLYSFAFYALLIIYGFMVLAIVLPIIFACCFAGCVLTSN